MYNYPIRFERDDSAQGVAVFCRDLPELNSYGDNESHALTEAADAIETTLALYVDQRREIPQSSKPEAGEHVIHLSAVTVAKIELWNTMIDRSMRKADLCRLLGVSQTQGDRLVDFTHTSKMEALESALEKLGIQTSLVRAPVILTSYDDSPSRAERLAKVIGYVQAIRDMNQLGSIEGEVMSIHDHKGVLQVIWNHSPTDLEKHAFHLAWQSDIGDGTELVEHMDANEVL